MTAAEIVYTVDTGEKLVNETFGPNNIRRRTSGTEERHRVEIRNARNEKVALEKNGFQLVGHETAVRDFFDPEQLKSVYYPEVERLVKELSGAKRVVVFDHTLRSGDEAESCVDAGRSAYRTARFAAGGTSLYASLRADKGAQVTDSLRFRGRHQSDQAYIWKSPAARQHELDTRTPMGAMHDVFERHDPTIAAAREALGAQPRQIGSLVYLYAR